MNTSVFFSDILATAIVIPGILMCIIPLRSKLRIAPSQFLPWYIPLVSVLCIFSAYIECRTGVFGNSLAFFILLALLCGSSFAAQQSSSAQDIVHYITVFDCYVIWRHYLIYC